MFRLKTKTKVDTILKLLLQINRKLRLVKGAVPVDILEDCQQSVISIGECLECQLPDRNDIIKELENYCEELFLLSQEPEQKDSIIDRMDALLHHVRGILLTIQGVYQVAFMPYKAEMWDSLESIWMEFAQDDRCETLVIPLPYSTFDVKEKVWNSCNDEHFPDYVPIIDYKQYDLESETPEIVFIHNPYDQYNRVTRIEESYFSVELKKSTQILVYVPYYATTGSLSIGHRELSVYYNMDYMIAQSEKAKECLKGYSYYDKVLTLGSPKFDKVIRKCKEGVTIPKEWRNVLEGRPCLMLNTTISDLLSDGELLLLKHRFFFELIKESKRVAVIWRPHPLLESTIKAMRPELLELYHEVTNYFNLGKIGVIDNGPDMTDTIAIADGYVGSAWSSVVNSFGVSGKPMYFFDNLIMHKADEHRRKLISACAAVVVDNKVWLVSGIFNGLLSIDLNQKMNSVKLEKIILEEPRWMYSHMSIDAFDGKIYMAARWAKQHVEYNQNTGMYRLIKKPVGWEDEEYLKILVGKYKIVLFPAKKQEIIFYDKSTQRWKREYEALLAMWEGVRYDTSMFSCRDVILVDNVMWIVSEQTNKILQYDIKLHKYQVYQIDNIEGGFSSIAVEDDEIWLADASGVAVYKYYIRSGSLQVFSFPKSYKVKRDVFGFKIAQLKLFIMKDWVVTIPSHSNLAFRIDKKSGKIDILASKFWADLDEFHTGYNPYTTQVCSIASKIDADRILVQRNTDLAMAIINVENNSYEMFFPELDDVSYNMLLDGQDGFDKTSLEALFCCWESNIFPLEDFIDNFADGKYKAIEERQLEILSGLAENLDGTCGKKVHDCILGKVSV